ncbi:MAG: alkaline phosphatase family protein [Solirubrobacteraceae bacterium]
MTAGAAIRRVALAVGVVAALLAITGCGTSARRVGPVQTVASPVASLPGGAPAHVAVIVMENEEFSNIIGSSETPFINGLARHYALARAMYATKHPSLPNYLALTGGSPFGISSDCTDCHVAASGLGEQLSHAGIPWRAYMEDLPRPCYRGDSAGNYAKKHDPFLYYVHLAATPSECRNVVALTELGTAERSGSLPRFAWITPNLCHDMHDCDPATGDRFLRRIVPPLLAALGHNGLLFLTWDEGSSDDGCCRQASGGHIVTILAGAGARAGAVMRTPADQYSILQTIEDLLGLPRLRGAACRCTPSLAPLLAH